jgi:hypothetical protein
MLSGPRPLSIPLLSLSLPVSLYSSVLYPLTQEFYPKSLVDLVQRHKNEGLPRPVLLRVAQGIARGMHYLHSLPTPVIHRVRA